MNIFKRVVRIFCYIAVLGAITLLGLSGFHNDTLEVIHFTYDTAKINEGEFKAIVVADLHHRESLNFQGGSNLVTKIKEEKPNAIFLCGDLVDDWNDKELKNQKELLDGIKEYPTYYITGNHEHRSPHFQTFINLIKDRSWTNYIDDAWMDIPASNIRVFGLHDNAFDNENRKETGMTYPTIDEQLDRFKDDVKKDKFNIILTHNPANVGKIKQYGYDAIFSGHTHGGQFRLGSWSPLTILHGLNAYNAGEYKIDNNDNQRVYVTKGLGYSAMFPIRVNCLPDILSITFK